MCGQSWPTALKQEAIFSKCVAFFKNNKQCLIFHVKYMLAADDSREIACLIFPKIKKGVTKVAYCSRWRFKG